MENIADNARRCHPARQNSSGFHPSYRAEVFICQNCQPALSYEHIETFTKDLEVRRDPGNLVSPVNLAQPGSSKEALNPGGARGGGGTAICGLYRYVPL